VIFLEVTAEQRYSLAVDIALAVPSSFRPFWPPGGANLLCGPMPLTQGLSNEDQDVIGHIAAAGNQLEQYVGTKDTGTGPALKHLVFSGVK